MIRFSLAIVLALTSASFADNALRIAQLEKENAQLKAQVFELTQKLKAMEAKLAAAEIGKPTTQPGGETDDAVMASADAPSSPSREWVVLIVSNEPIDASQFHRQVEQERAKLPGLEERISAAQKRYDEMSAAYDYYYDPDDGERKRRRKYNQEQLGSARLDIKKAEDERRQTNSRIARLERQIVDAESGRMIAGTLDDGTACLIEALSAAQAPMVAAMEIGQRYKVAGASGVRNGSTIIRARTIASAE